MVELVGDFADVLVAVYLDLELVRFFGVSIANGVAFVVHNYAKIWLCFVNLLDREWDRRLAIFNRFCQVVTGSYFINKICEVIILVWTLARDLFAEVELD